MFKIIERKQFSSDVFMVKVHAPDIARKRKAGQFIIYRVDEDGERIPLTVADADARAGWIMLVFQAVGKSTMKLANLNAGDSILDLVGPLGQPTHIEKMGGAVVCIGGGIGIAPVYPIAQAHHKAGNRVISILGARTKELLIMEDMMRKVSDEVLLCTDDGSYGEKGLVTDVLKKLVARGEKIAEVIAIGPAIMMKFVALTTKEFNIPTLVSLNAVMIDGTGMCGGCRVTVGGETRFVCVDGPEFDGHKVNFDELMSRQRTYLDQEKMCREQYQHQCKLGR
jgi:ferredoxin--NADP+ reductase